MGNKQLRKRIDVSLRGDCTQAERMFILEYYLLQSIAEDLDELTGKEIFGIEVIKKEGEKEEKASIWNVSCSKEHASRILDKLADNEVTPVSMKYVIEDIIAEA